MASNFDFLKDIDEQLFNLIEDAQKLFRDEYFNQCCVQLRIFGEVLIKKIQNCESDITFDEALNNFKDKIQDDRQKELVDDLYFIKQQGNASAHGEDIDAIKTLEGIRRAFEASINYAYFKKKDKKIDKLIFDDTLLITQKPKQEEKLIDKYLKAARVQNSTQTQEELLKEKEIEFKNAPKEELFKDKNTIKPKKKKKELTPVQKKVKEKVKEARKNLKENINKKPKKPTKKQIQQTKKKKDNLKKAIIFLIFVTISLFFIIKMLFFI